MSYGNLPSEPISITPNTLFSTVENDPNGVRIYTLKNGLKLYLAQNFDAPKIQTFIAVKTGSNNDPADNTGLAHYLEHMMFKGSASLGTRNWLKEKPLLDEITALFEKHKTTTGAEEKKQIYQQIDTLSQKAAEFALANEYDKAVSTLGASATNAHTWLDETVYKNVIPSNELDRWLQIEKERFSGLALRLFHTELETVYEEFNRAQDNDGRLVHYKMMEALFPKHPNGQQTTLGKAEHLKNPSMAALQEYFHSYYVPNNYAMILVGDLQFEETVALVERYFGNFASKPLPQKETVEETPLVGVTEHTVYSPTAERLHVAWRTDSYGTQEAHLALLTAGILSNTGECGLIDLNINQAQKALYAASHFTAFKKYGCFMLVIVPREEQTLDEAKELLLEQLRKISRGEFAEWLPEALVNDYTLQRLKKFESPEGLGTALYTSFINDISWQEELLQLQKLAAVTKKDLMLFAQKLLESGYVVVKKEKGTNENLLRVQNPGITPVKLNKDEQSVFLQTVLAQKTPEITPQFIDYKSEIFTCSVKGRTVSFVCNRHNDLAAAYLIFPFGKDHDRLLSLVTESLHYFDTTKFSAAALKEEFFKIGVTVDFRTSADETLIALSGLENNIGAGLSLLKHWLQNAVPDQEVFKELVSSILQSRELAKKNKEHIMSALQSYAKYGADSRFRDVISATDMENLAADVLTRKASELLAMPYEIFYYGKDLKQFSQDFSEFTEAVSVQPGPPRQYPEPQTTGKCYFVHYDMVQVEVNQVAKAASVNPSVFGMVNVFNEYFGRGLSSIVFQELRESQSLAYSAYVSYNTASQSDRADYLNGYIGTQPDKLPAAANSLQGLLKNLPQIPSQFEIARKAALKQIAASRITRTNIFFSHHRLKKLGIEGDFRKDLYRQISDLDLQKLTAFFNENIKQLSYNFGLLGDRQNVLTEAANLFNDIDVLQPEDIFNY